MLPATEEHGVCSLIRCSWEI